MVSTQSTWVRFEDDLPKWKKRPATFCTKQNIGFGAKENLENINDPFIQNRLRFQFKARFILLSSFVINFWIFSTQQDSYFLFVSPSRKKLPKHPAYEKLPASLIKCFTRLLSNVILWVPLFSYFYIFHFFTLFTFKIDHFSIHKACL